MKRLRLALAQINPTVGDIDGNTVLIIEAIGEAKARGCHMVAFPELALTGYPPEDLLFKPGFIRRNREALEEVAKASEGIVSIVGFVDRETDIYNAAGVLLDGEVKAVYRKRHLPNYGVFDEVRYFQRGEELVLLEVEGYKIGLSVCEDIWVPDNPVNELAVAGAELVVNINASPFSVGKAAARREMLRVRARDNLVSLAYVNMAGGQDELVFDGRSKVLDCDGKIVAAAGAFEEELLVCDLELDHIFRKQLKDSRLRTLRSREKPEVKTVRLDLPLTENPPLPAPEPAAELSEEAEVYQALVSGLRDYMGKNGFSKAVLGLSGGVDSALVAAVAADALGPENVKAVMMPSRYTSTESLEDAAALAKNLGIEYFSLSIDQVFAHYLDVLGPLFEGKPADVTEENLQARIRGNYLMALSNKFGWIVVATGNKSEMSVGYATLYGDMVGGFALLKDVRKGRVYALCRHRNRNGEVIPERILTRPPSAELAPDQKDQDSLPPYDILDEVVRLYVEEDYSAAEIVGTGLPEEAVKRVVSLIDRNEYKRRQAPIGIKITERAYGKDRRMPVTNRFR